jgi:wobble nucleotide-excising tRNase
MTIKITMSAVASYKAPTCFESDKKVTLIYGLNGTGKSTLSNFFSNPAAPIYSNCRSSGLEDAQVHVYNTNFVKDNFYEMDKIKGIFTLSKSNKVAEESLKDKRAEIIKHAALREGFLKSKNLLAVKLAADRELAEEAVWKIKTKYSGGDRVLEYCLEGLKAKARLFEHLASIALPTVEPTKTIESLRKEAEVLQGENAQRYSKLTKLTLAITTIEQSQLFSKVIIGNQDSSVAELIAHIDNADWVSEGIVFMDRLQTEGDDSCPFCQSKTINTAVRDAIKGYFDETFSQSVADLRNLLANYESHANSMPEVEIFLDNPLWEDDSKDFKVAYQAILSQLDSNKSIIERKIRSPSSVVSLIDSSALIAEANLLIDRANSRIDTHNAKIENKSKALSEIKNEFWRLCRWEYDQTISPYQIIATSGKDEIKLRSDEIDKENAEIDSLTNQARELQKQTVNVDASIDVINSRLSGLGIDSFTIIKHEENTYRLSRNGVAAEDFQSLSEGEKTVISFVYFIELCKGAKNASDIVNKKIVVIDDPISSLSHIYVFNIGQMIKQELCNSDKFFKIVIMTHSLYFFYELTDINKERRNKNQKLLRLAKNFEGSKIVDMRYEEIQNDYQSYWSVIFDKNQPPALIANCMRNVIETFFNFVKKRDLNNVFQSAELSDPKHQAFYRFINRESHSLGQNIFDYKEFDYALFHEGFKILFEVSGFSEHYIAMTK